MEKITKRIANWLARNDAIDDRDIELYEYAIYSLLVTISPLLIVLVIGVIMGIVSEGIVVLLPFMCIRKFSGGYHAKNSSVCFVGSVMILVICMWLAYRLEYSWGITFLTALATLSLCVNSPIESLNKQLDDLEKAKFGRVAKVLSGIFMTIHVICVLSDLKKLAMCLSIGICLTAILQLPSLFQFHNEEEKTAL